VERTKLVSGEMCVMVCIAVTGRIQCGEMIKEEKGRKTSKARTILGKTWDSNKYDSQQN
jgi:hypothetical protein